MRQKMQVLTALAVLAGAGVMVTATTYAQTSGGDRRDDRRDNRQGSRAQKQACKAGDENAPSAVTRSAIPSMQTARQQVAPRRQRVAPRHQQVAPRRQSSPHAHRPTSAAS